MHQTAVPSPAPTSPAVFFRDAAALEPLKNLLRPRLRDPRLAAKPLRVWIPECGEGQDSYSVAIALFEALGGRWREVPLQIFSTDADGAALARARAGWYPLAFAAGVSPKRLLRWFTREDGRLRVRPLVRKSCLFVPPGAGPELPFNRLDLIAARGTLSPLTESARKDALRAFHGCLSTGGVLLDQTGAAADEPDLFAPVGAGRSYAARPRAARPTAAGLADAARLRESEERFRVLFAHTEDAVVVRDAETGRVIEANAAAERLYGWSAVELSGMSADALLAAPGTVRRASGERRSEERLRMPHGRRKDGTTFPADASASFLMLHGRPCELVTVRDASPRLRAEGGAKRAADREAFLGDVVHELRSPLSVISGSAETLRGGVRGGDREEYLHFIETSSARMARLIDRLLELASADARTRELRPALVPLSAAVWEVAGAFAPVARRRGIKLSVEVPPDLAVYADPADLPHILGNLIDNALKFSPRGGRVEVRARADGGECVLEVDDTGPGLSAEDLGRVFERFYRGERTRKTKGTGLGLAIVASLAKSNRGGVAAGASASGGASFRVTLPLAARETLDG